MKWHKPSELVAILMDRDMMSRKDAEQLVIDTRQEMIDCDFDSVMCEEIIQYNLGVEMDYLFDII